MSRISHFLIGTALIVPTPISLIAIGYNVSYYQSGKQDQPFPQQNKGSLDSPDSQPKHVDDNPTSRFYEQSH